jgi:hypothetical protein
MDTLQKKGVYKAQTNAGNSVQGTKTGHQKLHYLEAESFSGSWHATGHTGPRFNEGIMQS